MYRTVVGLVVLISAACASPRQGRSTGESVRTINGTIPQESMHLIYNRMGLIATESPLPFVGKVAYYATASPDTTLVLAVISFANRALTFVRENEQFTAPYDVRILMSRDSVHVQSASASEIVRIANFREISRSDESIIFQHFFRATPGHYRISYLVRDAGSLRSAAQEGVITVPQLQSGQLSTPLLVYEANSRSSLDSIPKLLPSPRSSATFGQDSTIPLYLEGYGPGNRLPITYGVKSEDGKTIWTDTAVLPRRGALFSGIMHVPVARSAVGISTVSVTRPGSLDTVSTRVFVGFGPDVPILSFEELIAQLRFFATADRLQALRETPVDERGKAWAAFLLATDPVPSTPEHEGLQAYFSRIAIANIRFRTGGENGWLSDRGAVFVTLGEPDQIIEQLSNQTNRTVFSSNGRVQIWEYGQYNIRLYFIDSGSGSWQMTPSSRSDFASLAGRVLVR